MTLAVSLMAVAGFAVVLWWTAIGTTAQKATQTMFEGASALFDSELDDDAKEQALRRSGGALLLTAWRVGWRFALAFGVAALPIVSADVLGLVQSADLLGLMMRIDYILIVSAVAIVAVWGINRIRGRARDAYAAPTAAGTIGAYSGVDRFFHELAFATPAVLRAASWIDDRISKTPHALAEKPIFVTSLARGGTTALLNALHDIPGVATHTYRDMPFITAPQLWAQIAGKSSRGVARQQRAHGDGLEIDLDTPEAFEEILWKMFWPKHYANGQIRLWRAEDGSADAEAFLRRHMGKIVTMRAAEAEKPPVTGRYCSKNNANIGRLAYLPKAFADASIVVPVRRPESHAASLLRQHQNFMQRQADDDFVRRYMRDIGHFEFGLIHQPIAFPGFVPGDYDLESPNYWLHYWICAFREATAQSAACLFVSQDDLRAAPEETMGALCDALGLETGDMRFRSYFRTEPDVTARDVFDPALLAEATKLYDYLMDQALPC